MTVRSRAVLDAKQSHASKNKKTKKQLFLSITNKYL